MENLFLKIIHGKRSVSGLIAQKTENPSTHGLNFSPKHTENNTYHKIPIDTSGPKIILTNNLTQLTSFQKTLYKIYFNVLSNTQKYNTPVLEKVKGLRQQLILLIKTGNFIY